MKDKKDLEKRLGFVYENQALLDEALTHKSFKKSYDNERLEFLGDAVLDLVVGEYLYKKYPSYDEGKLSKLRASLVNEEGFTKLANHLKLGEYIYLSNAEENNNGRAKPSLLSNAFEAIIGAMYLSSSLAKVEEIVIKLLEEVYPDMSLENLFKDYKTTLQELTQARFGSTPEYKLIGSRGPDHLKEFEISVYIEDKEYARALGKSKKIAQQIAAQIALEKLQEQK